MSEFEKAMVEALHAFVRVSALWSPEEWVREDSKGSRSLTAAVRQAVYEECAKAVEVLRCKSCCESDYCEAIDAAAGTIRALGSSR